MRYYELNEAVYGKLAAAYHRTAYPDNIEAMKTKGIQPGFDGLYGAGIYLTYELASQFTDYMKRYGDFLVKCRVNLQGFLVLDVAIASAVYGRQASIRDQIKINKFGCTVNDKILDIWEAGLSRPRLTANTAQNIVERQLITGMRGIVFTGQHDGHVIVAFDRAVVRPMAWCEAPADQPSEPLAWQTFK